MPGKTNHAVNIQRQYYTETAERYERMHEHEGFGDKLMTKYIYSLLRILEARSLLDVGTATGRSLPSLKLALPDLFVCGVEPVAALIEQAVRSGHTASGPVVQANGEALPFGDASFDVVCEFSILHHVSNPNAIVKEMLRVARRAVLISDSNRFGQGSTAIRFAKLLLYKSKLWTLYNYLRTFGRGYRITEGDGLAYSYSVFDSFELISNWADRIILVPGDHGKASSWFHPLLNSGGVLVCAFRESR